MSARRSRTVLLVLTVALCSALIVAVSSAMTSVQRGIKMRVAATVGAADLRIRHIGGAPFDIGVLSRIEGWPEVEAAVPRSKAGLTLRNQRSGKGDFTVTYGIMPERENALRPARLVEGRLLRGDGEIVLDTAAAENLGARLGDTLTPTSSDTEVSLTVVGIVMPPALGVIAKAEGFVTLNTLGDIAGRPGEIVEIDLSIKRPEDAAAVAAAHQHEVPEPLLLQTTERITSGLTKNMQTSRIALIVATVLSFLSASFIILTGLTTNVTERQRELAVMRCIGGTRLQLGVAQVLVGLLIGVAGALVGIPAGAAASAAFISFFPEQLPGGFVLSLNSILSAAVGATLSGCVGAAWPAFRASTTSPLAALASRAATPRPRGVLFLLMAGLAGIATQVVVLTVPHDADLTFWLEALVGLPMMFTGYFLLAVPATVAVAGLLADSVVSPVLRLPPRLLRNTVLATPYRHGFTAGAMMVGLAIFIAIWTNGRAVARDWLDSLDFPDGFVSGVVPGVSFNKATQEKIEDVPGVANTCALTLQTVGTTAFGVDGFSRYKTTFIAFEPDRFFSMMRIKFIQGDEATALAALERGGAVLVAREFLVTKGLGVGDSIELAFPRSRGGGRGAGAAAPPDEQSQTFEIVGVVTSPGLEVVNKYFDIGEQYLHQAVNAVFGSRADLIRMTGNDSISLIAIDIADGHDDERVIGEVRKLTPFAVAGSGKGIKDEIRTFLRTTVFILSAVGVAAMLVACFGVANLIVAGIDARRFEFGVLRAVGAQRALLARLVMGEALLIAITSCTVGTFMGVQAAWGEQRMYAAILGLSLQLRLPMLPIAAGWLVVTLITLAAAGPAVWKLMQRRPRELLASMKG